MPTKKKITQPRPGAPKLKREVKRKIKKNSLPVQKQPQSRPRPKPATRGKGATPTKKECEGLVPDHKLYNLSLPQLRFVANYILHDGNVSAAGRACAPDKTKVAAAGYGKRMMLKDNVLEAIDGYRAQWFDDLKRECRDKVLKVLSVRAFYDPAKIVSRDGNFLSKDNPDYDPNKDEDVDYPKQIRCDLNDVPRGLRDCIDGVERKSAGNNGIFTTLKLANKTESIRMLTEYMHLFENDGPGQEITEETEKQLREVFKECS